MTTAILLAGATPAAAQVRFEGFGFSADYAGSTRSAPGAQITGAAALRIGAQSLELAAGSATNDAFISAIPYWRAARFTYGAGAALHSSGGSLQPAASAILGYAIPLAPNGAAALQLVTRAAVMKRETRGSLGVAVLLAPRRGMQLGENVEAPKAPKEVTRSWEAVVAQVMLLDNGSSSLNDVLATESTLVMRFAPVQDSELQDDVARVARILAGSTEAIYLTIAAPRPPLVAAAVTSGGFPAERITSADAALAITLQATRIPASPIRSAQSLPRQ